ncbi:hypothetical protein ABH930_004373 [Kitasatospora sp. GAS204A]|uniref:DUF397 domain-containing protein n=1 Tax=unclassified Kitasatospora TaxID=2633591 RepID=UPI0024762E0E|nr:DUF397 domain-containing protein [Kitasatospora sp. GAS204B]MDH6119615.1 hypothetical protein [Kitasatospora sp. GAS204B]
MTVNPVEFEFVKTAACQNTVRKSCPEVAVNVPGVVALRDSDRPREIVTMTPAAWTDFVAAVKAGEYDLSV